MASPSLGAVGSARGCFLERVRIFNPVATDRRDQRLRVHSFDRLFAGGVDIETCTESASSKAVANSARRSRVRV